MEKTRVNSESTSFGLAMINFENQIEAFRLGGVRNKENRLSI
jgi:hypothetical protein